MKDVFAYFSVCLNAIVTQKTKKSILFKFAG